jgi:hypothetical protein
MSTYLIGSSLLFSNSILIFTPLNVSIVDFVAFREKCIETQNELAVSGEKEMGRTNGKNAEMYSENKMCVVSATYVIQRQGQ